MTSIAASAKQIELLMQFMQDHENLARGRLIRDVEGKAVAKDLWTSLTNLLNGVGGAHKTTKQWQKVWSDKKYLAKKAAAASNRSANQTGGGPPSAPEISQSEQRVINILGEGFGMPDTHVAANPFPSMEAFTSAASLTIHNNSQQESPSILGDPTASCQFQLDISATPSSSRVVNAEASPIRPVAPTARSTASAPSVQRRRLRRPTPLVEDVRTRLFRLEEEKQKEIVRVRLQLEKLTDAVTSALIEFRRINNNN